jgi:hypothetical protein
MTSQAKDIISGSSPEATFTDLTAGTAYTVLIVTKAGDQQSDTASEIFYTSELQMIYIIE